MSRASQADPELDSLIAEITIDCYDEDEVLTAFENAFDDARLPCPGTVIGEDVEVLSVSTSNNRRELLATCQRAGHRHQNRPPRRSHPRRYSHLLPIAGLTAGDDDSGPDAIVAKLRFQQTKIEGAPNTIFVDAEIVAIIKAQQQWVHAHVKALLRDPAAPPPRYLFLAIAQNNRGRHSYPKTTVTVRLQQLAELADIRDSQGRRPPLSHVHRFRHTRGTSLINSGVPVHVVQRYLGHLSPEMTMRYAHTLRETHEREFLRYKKITADGSDLDIDPRDLFSLIELGKRTDRVLPNGLCMLPPRQTCNRGNACLTCDKFTTDASYLPEHQQQLDKLSELIAQRQAAFRARTGEAMTASNVWLQQRLSEQRALQKIITVLDDPQLTDDPDQAVRGPATDARRANQPADGPPT
jgi:hypothetical protein